MQAKKLAVYTANINIVTKIISKINSTKKGPFLIGLFITFLFTLSFAFIIDFNKTIATSNNRTIYISDFKLDISKLSETAAIIESKRTLDSSLQVNKFGSNEEIVKFDEITPDLKIALTNIADTNNDKKLSNDEISELQIMRLNSNAFQKELKTHQLSLESADRNLKNFAVITHGKYAGTILYNGPLKFVDDENRHYFGLDLFY